MRRAEWFVTVKYDPGTPRTYAVRGAPDQFGAKDAVLAHIRYNPGVPILCVPLEGQQADETIEWHELSAEEKLAIRFND